MTHDEREQLARDYLEWARWVAFRDLSHTHRGRVMLTRDPCVVDDTVDLAMVRTLDRWDAAGVSFASYLGHQIRYEVCNKLRPLRGLGRLKRWSTNCPGIDPVAYKWAWWHGLGVEPDWLLVHDQAPAVVDADDTLDTLLTGTSPRTATVFRLLVDGGTHDEIGARAGLRKKQVENTIYLNRPALQARWEQIA